MSTRRQFLFQSSSLAAIGPLTACAGPSAEYETSVKETWRHAKGTIADAVALKRELVRYATLAPSSHNTQCWKFKVEDRAISVLPDFSRRCPVVDPDDHHLFVTLGCATENLIQAAAANGFKGESLFDSGAEFIKVSLEPMKASASAMFQAIPQRQCTRAEYDGKPLTQEELDLLAKAGSGNGVRVILLTERAAMDKVLEYVVQGNTAQLTDRAFFDELKSWIRFNGAQAARTGDGLYGGSSGNPSLPTWLGNMMLGFVLTPKSENDKYAKQMRSSAGIAAFVSDVNDKAHWVEVGRAYERFALQATALGIRNAFLNQPVEVTALRSQFASYLGVGSSRPDLVARFGRGNTTPPSLRRPVEAVLV